jgi:hypothetical protein
MAISCIPKIPYSFSESAGGEGLVLSSTNLNFDNCLYAKNTINAIIKKSIYLKSSHPQKL